MEAVDFSMTALGEWGEDLIEHDYYDLDWDETRFSRFLPTLASIGLCKRNARNIQKYADCHGEETDGITGDVTWEFAQVKTTCKKEHGIFEFHCTGEQLFNYKNFDDSIRMAAEHDAVPPITTYKFWLVRPDGIWSADMHDVINAANVRNGVIKIDGILDYVRPLTTAEAIDMADLCKQCRKSAKRRQKASQTWKLDL